jgi:menaquinone-dependent protoporphyrinogen oxidase
MTVLVAVASRHGSTREIAELIGRTLEEHGLEVVVAPVDEIDDVAPYDAVVLGSAVYVGKWLEPARRFVDAHAVELAARPTWLFSSGPIGTPPKPEGDKAVEVGSIVARTGAREHRVFAGKLDRSGLGLGERMVVRAVRAEEGDFRELDEVVGWASTIAGDLTGSADAKPVIHGDDS